ncbi:MAG TPA: MASE4 domain-containing protein [Steroidobacteraceae bacterium]|nr:MASE4 domain-containing protein [Steroidobacteraceae bacterium]
MSIDPATGEKPGTSRQLDESYRKQLVGSRAWLKRITSSGLSSAQASDREDTEAAGPDEQAFLASTPAGPAQKRLALAAVIVSAAVFLALLPFVRMPLARMPAFIGSYEAALSLIDLITAILLFGQFTRLRSRALLVLASGYLFNTFIIVAHALTFPGVFSDMGLLSAGDQTTVWLYVFWHGGFPLFVLGYAMLRAWRTLDRFEGAPGKAIAAWVTIVGASVVFLTLLSTVGMELLPTLITEEIDFSLMIATGASPLIWTLSFAAFVILCRQRSPSVLDLWLRVVMFSWLFDVTLSAILSSSRYALGWYAGRSYGLTAASFVLIVLLLETNSLHNKLATARVRLAANARELESRVRKRTLELVQSNAKLKVQIFEREQAEKKLEGTRAFFNAIIESLPAMLLVKTASDGKVVLVNRAAERLLGYDRSEIIGKTAIELLPEQDAKKIRGQDEQTLLKDDALEDEITLTTRKLGVRRLRMKKFPLLEAEGTTKYLVAFAEDVTVQHQTEEQLLHAQKMEAIGHLTGGLAHDFNNLLAVIIGNLDVVSELGPSSPLHAELTAAALEAALSGAELTRRLLAFARRQPLQPENVDVNALVSGITKLLGRTLGEDIEITLNLDPAIKPVLVDRVQLETAITNLANNARDAMPTGGRLIVATYNGYLDRDYIEKHSEVAAGEYVTLEISDTGQGMAPEVAEHIFEPFYTTKGLGKGTGLGLSMVFGFVKQSAGHINVYSEPGRGTTFRLYLQPSKSASRAPVVEAPPLQPQFSDEDTVLIVEDSSKLRTIVVKQLEAIGLRVFEAGNAQAALDLLKSQPKIDLILSDVVLPGDMDGYALARTIQQHYPQSKIIMTSGFPGIRFNETELGPKLPLLSKPYRRQDLIRMVREALEERAQSGVA